MFNQYHTNVRATIEFLSLLKVRVNNATVNENLQNHPDWPSLLCISDALSKWNIPNGAGKIDPINIDELPTPFMARTNNLGAPMVIVANVTDKKVQIYQKNYNKLVTKSKDDFIKTWNGIYLIAEPNEYSGEPNYEKNKRKTFLSSLIPIAALVLLVIVSFMLIRRVIETTGISAPSYILGVYLQYLIMLAGVVVTSFLVWYEIDKNNPFLKKVCTGIAKSDCSAIVTGNKSKLFGWLSWSELGLFYFMGGLLALLFAGSYVIHNIAVLAWLNILALPYIVFSIYYQWQVAKQWCMLCLAVQVLLLMGGINVIFNNFIFPSLQFSISIFINVIIIYLLPALIWYTLKPYIQGLQKAEDNKREYMRVKFNADIFNILLKKQKSIAIPTADGLGIDIGNPMATNTLIKVCSTYCGPCSKAHPKIEKLLEGNTNLKVKIIFTVSDKVHDPAVKPISHLLAIAEQANEATIQKALNDWYLPNAKDYERFAAHYPMNRELLNQSGKIDAMNKWCKSAGISYTPTIFINGYQLPDAYNIEDLQYFLLDSPTLGVE
ncbi:vitamin K epoxide reductase family protein [Pontibacter russatus]|uniref:vitamin K epoxide reductase family protein n=1 Tax=Pontibacter russatus TaxID=2694929 RepID=UPI00137AD3DD|nr:vitamin K epoxide reductase family protein [Pontibacter russatus]